MALSTRHTGVGRVRPSQPPDSSSFPSCSYPPAPTTRTMHFRAQHVCASLANLDERSKESNTRVADETYMQEYAAMKSEMLSVSQNAGGIIATYLLVTVDGVAALCALAGSACGNLYLRLLCADVDSYVPGSKIAMDEAYKIEDPLTRSIAKVFAGYSHGLNRRLLVPIGLAVGVAVFNKLTDQSLDLLHQGCVLLGFLAYKAPLFLRVVKDNSPKSYQQEQMNRPIIEKFDDELDQFGRPKKSLYKMPTEALPDNVDTSQLSNLDLENITSFEDAIKVLKDASRAGTNAGGSSSWQDEEKTGSGSSEGGIQRRVPR
ncbi:hypothetical protein V8C86DRAFT_2981247 [Haematococcus lacustris]